MHKKHNWSATETKLVQTKENYTVIVD